MLAQSRIARAIVNLLDWFFTVAGNLILASLYFVSSTSLGYAV